MDLRLSGKKAIVSGSTAGIGLAAAQTLAAEGADVVLNGRSPARVEAAVQHIRAALPKARVSGVAADLATRAGAETLRTAVPEADILVNNLGIFDPKPFDQISDEEWTRFFEVNVLSGVRLSRAYLPGMLKRNWGRIVFVSSESGINIPSEMIHYGMTKTAQLAVSRGLAELTKGTAVTVNSVLPGPTKSEGVEAFVDKLSAGKPFEEFEQEFFNSVRPASLLRRFATVEEIASLIAYVCSPLAAATNGAALRCDGGIVHTIV
ncbi:MAG TPA: SDR family oxidoreductase [Phycisphaerales bacterium]|mgnify:FL=1|nr:SDR family oxidoreductase [Phycisphaerales bacterium]